MNISKLFMMKENLYIIHIKTKQMKNTKQGTHKAISNTSKSGDGTNSTKNEKQDNLSIAKYKELFLVGIKKLMSGNLTIKDLKHSYKYIFSDIKLTIMFALVFSLIFSILAFSIYSFAHSSFDDNSDHEILVYDTEKKEIVENGSNNNFNALQQMESVLGVQDSNAQNGDESTKIVGFKQFYSEHLDIHIHYPNDWNLSENNTKVDCNEGLEVMTKYWNQLKDQERACTEEIYATEIVIDTGMEKYSTEGKTVNYKLRIASNLEVANSCGEGRMVEVQKTVKDRDSAMRGCLNNRVLTNALGSFPGTTGTKSKWKDVLVHWTLDSPQTQEIYSVILKNIE